MTLRNFKVPSGVDMYLRKQGKHCVAWPHLVRFFRGFWATDRCGRRHDFQSIRVPISQPIGKRGFADASKSSIHRNRLCFGRQARRHGAGHVRGARRENCTLGVKAQVCLHLATRLRNAVGHTFIECHSTTWSQHETINFCCLLLVLHVL